MLHKAYFPHLFRSLVGLRFVYFDIWMECFPIMARNRCMEYLKLTPVWSNDSYIDYLLIFIQRSLNDVSFQRSFKLFIHLMYAIAYVAFKLKYNGRKYAKCNQWSMTNFKGLVHWQIQIIRHSEVLCKNLDTSTPTELLLLSFAS